MLEREQRLDAWAAAVVQQTMDSLPAAVREAARACVIEPVFMADRLASEDDLEDDLLGLFEGCSLADQEPEAPGQLPRIRLFLDNLWEYVERDAGLFREEVRVTLLHELGHFLGYDEDQVEERGLA